MAKISYIKTDWVDNETKLNAENMNHIEKGIEAIDIALGTKLDKSNVVQTTGQSTDDVMSQKAVTDELDSKVDIITEDKRVYRTYSASDTNYTTFSTGVNPYTFMVRDETANTYVSTPTHPSHCATKKYVDNKTNFGIFYSSSDMDISKVICANWIANSTTNNIIGYEYFYNNPLYISGVQQTNVVEIDFVNETIGYLMDAAGSAQYYLSHFSESYVDSGMTQQLTLEWFSSAPYWSVNSISYIVYK